MQISATIDVPDIAAGLAFYGAVFGLAEIARPHPDYVVLGDGGQNPGQTLGLARKAPGTRPTPADGPVRDYARHWTPVHLDFHVADFEAACAQVTANGGACEQRHEAPGRPSVAFCCDPFGHGFCILGPRPA